ncbi:hypothetical protein FGG08_000757 [Glutinoglossum americanum]|uniref:Extracellular membrane protein CFEM domain-containing protein n=1 Tax=Glutinoglossum americanum TaxID=1670608 RepID=A0A9P8L5U0_9PEZI|nr:hypothetical protein FGG08_000757 [Glutinoglossum americanum]
MMTHAAFGYNRHSPRAILPPEILAVIPGCAQPCISDFIVHSYPPGVACDLQKDLACLCGTNTATGLTLDESAIICILEFCPPPNPQTLSICGDKETLPSTHLISPLPLTSASAPLSRTPTQPQITIAAVTAATLSSITGQPQSQPKMASTSPAVTTEFPSGLTGAQIAGITAGAVTAVVFGLGIFLLVRCTRRQNELKRQRTPTISRPIPIRMEYGQDIRSIDSEVAGFSRPVALQKVTRKSFSDWTPGYTRTDDIGIAVSPETQWTPKSDGQSVRTMSGLLPENPVTWPQHSPAPVGQRAERGRPSSTATEFEDVD